MKPTQRSVLARQPSKTFDGGCRDDVFWRATMIRRFPRNAVTDRGIFNNNITIFGCVSIRLDWQTSMLAIVCYCIIKVSCKVYEGASNGVRFRREGAGRTTAYRCFSSLKIKWDIEAKKRRNRTSETANEWKTHSKGTRQTKHTRRDRCEFLSKVSINQNNFLASQIQKYKLGLLAYLNLRKTEWNPRSTIWF